VTLNNGRIGISGSVLFAVNSDQLRADGRQLLEKPGVRRWRSSYLGERDEEMLMVSGFTDNVAVSGANRHFAEPGAFRPTLAHRDARAH